MARLDVQKRHDFAIAYAELGNATQAAVRAGVPRSSAHSMGYKWLRDERVVAQIREAMNERLRELGPLAIEVIRDVLLSPNVAPQTRLQAARDVMDRLGWVPPKRADIVAEDARPLEELSLRELEEFASGHRGAKLDEASLIELAQEGA